MKPKNLIILAIAFIMTGTLIASLQKPFEKENIEFRLVGEAMIQLEYGETYEEQGAEVYLDGQSQKQGISIDASRLNQKKIGVYEVLYSYISPKQKIYTITRQVVIRDTVKPVITLQGDEVLKVEIGRAFIDPGCKVTDNYDKDVEKKLTSKHNVDMNTIGTYEVTYTAIDSGNNTAVATRKVEVLSRREDDEQLNAQQIAMISNLKWTEKGFYLEIKSSQEVNQISILDQDQQLWKIAIPESTAKNTYQVSFALPLLPNKTYELRVRGTVPQTLRATLDPYQRIVRRNLNNKLLTVEYGSNSLKFRVEDNPFTYDIVIDPGHGGGDSGTTTENESLLEKNVNLMQSLYEKKRYEEHGLKVLMMREDDTYGIMMGPTDWSLVSRRAYAIGYYGSISRITYSNHHNWSENREKKGWAIIVPAAASKEELAVPLKVMEAWRKSYPVEEDTPRFFTRDVSDGAIYDKKNGKVYTSFTNYYAVNRYPSEIFRVNNILYEGSYFSNDDDVKWYYEQENWKKQSEEKIKCYVEYLGKTYIPPTM